MTEFHRYFDNAFSEQKFMKKRNENNLIFLLEEFQLNKDIFYFDVFEMHEPWLRN